MDFSLSPRAQSYIQRLSAFMQEHVLPAEAEYFAQVENHSDWRVWKQPPVMETLKTKAQKEGLWNRSCPTRSMAPASATLNMLRLRRSPEGPRSPQKLSTVVLPIPATWKCW